MGTGFDLAFVAGFETALAGAGAGVGGSSDANMSNVGSTGLTLGAFGDFSFLGRFFNGAGSPSASSKCLDTQLAHLVSKPEQLRQ